MKSIFAALLIFCLCTVSFTGLALDPNETVNLTDLSIIPHKDTWNFNDYETEQWADVFTDDKQYYIEDYYGNQVGLVTFQFVPDYFEFKPGEADGTGRLYYTLGVRVFTRTDQFSLYDNQNWIGINKITIDSYPNDPAWNEQDYVYGNPDTYNYNEIKITNEILHAGHSYIYGEYDPFTYNDNIDPFTVDELLRPSSVVSFFWSLCCLEEGFCLL